VGADGLVSVAVMTGVSEIEDIIAESVEDEAVIDAVVEDEDVIDAAVEDEDVIDAAVEDEDIIDEAVGVEDIMTGGSPSMLLLSSSSSVSLFSDAGSTCRCASCPCILVPATQ